MKPDSVLRDQAVEAVGRPTSASIGQNMCNACRVPRLQLGDEAAVGGQVVVDAVPGVPEMAIHQLAELPVLASKKAAMSSRPIRCAIGQVRAAKAW